jgi:peptidoglycan/LPS O-acetylase OafA/YrhL
MIDTVAGRARLPAGKVAPRARMPGLDGLRGLAVAGVVAYHLGAPGLGGGYLGVDLFFVLSGFLITGLLLGPQDGHARLGLAAFWGRRARRLLPALLVLLLMLSAAAAVGALSGVTDRGAFRDDVLATLGYVANWHQLVAGQSYFAQFAAPSPLAHAWSLGIEEQFYLLWPLALGALLWAAGRRAGRGGPQQRRRVLLAVTAGAALASAAWMAWLAAHGASADRLYYGTDTRAFDLLAGSALAISLWGRPEPSPGARRLRASAGVAGFAVLAVVWAWAGRSTGPTPSRWIFEGGMALGAVAALAVVADAAGTRPGALGRLLSVAPLRFLGRVSYALYLWHWPVITQLTGERTGLHGAALAGARLAVMGVAAVASTLLLEEPVRRWRRAGAGTAHRVLAPAAFAGAAAVAVLAALPTTAGAAAAGPAPATTTAVAGAGGLAHEAPLEAPGLAGASPLHPLRVTLVGDSVMRAQAPAVTAALESTGAAVVTDMAYPGWGLANDPGWASGVPVMLERTRAQMVVATWSWDDDWALSDQAGYRAALARFLATLLDPGGATGAQAVVLEQFPPLGPLPQASGGPAGQARRVAGVSAWNAAAASMPARFPGRVLYLPLAGAVETGGHYTSWLAAGPAGRWVRVRSVDATHFCPAGAARYAEALLADLRTELPLPPAGAWWSASWSRDPVYDSPPGSCPATGHPA